MNARRCQPTSHPASHQAAQQRQHLATWLRVWGLLTLLTLGSCGKTAGPFVTLLLRDFPQETKTVSLTVSVEGNSKTQQFSGNDTLSLITVELPVGTRGSTVFSAQTIMETGCVLGNGNGSLQIDDDKAFDLSLPIVAEPLSKCGLNGVKLTVKKAGTAQGTITSQPAGVSCDNSCNEQIVEFRQGTQVTLSAQLVGDDELAGWGGDCTGTLSSCTLTMGTAKTVTATINRCQGFCPLPATGTTSDLYAVWGASSSAIYAVGAGGTILKFDGTSWSTMPSGVTTTLRAVSAPRDNTARVLAVGDNGTILELSGATWKAFGTAPPTFQITSVAANTANNIYIAGASGNYQRWDGSKWNTPSGYSNSKNLTGISFMPGKEEHFLSGAGGLLVRHNPAAIVFKYPAQTTNTSANLNSVWAGSAAIYMVGDGGTIMKRIAGDGNDGMAMTSGTSVNLHGVFGANDQTLFAVGDGGTVLKSDGTTWSKVPTRTTRTLYSVYGIDTSNIVAVGEAGVALRYKP